MHGYGHRPTFGSEPERVVDEVRAHLGDPIRVDLDPTNSTINDLEGHAGAVSSSPLGVNDLLQVSCEIDRFGAQRELARLEPSEQHHVLDKSTQAPGLGVEHTNNAVHVAVLDLVGVESLGIAPDRGERGAQVVAHVHEELALPGLCSL